MCCVNACESTCAKWTFPSTYEATWNDTPSHASGLRTARTSTTAHVDKSETACRTAAAAAIEQTTVSAVRCYAYTAISDAMISGVAGNFRQGVRNCVIIWKQCADFLIPYLATAVHGPSIFIPK